MKIYRQFLAAILVCLACSSARAALTAGGIAALDGSGNIRTAFTNLETIALRQQVNNSAASSGRIQFKFTVYNPSGAAVFHQEGNSASAVPGNSNSQLSGLAIAMFYTVPGVYTFKGEAVLDAVTVIQEVRFSVSSPNINLTYPPNGARGITDNPLTFRWVGSGAASYRITVADNAGLYNPLHTDTAFSSLYMYPQNPTQPREQLVPDQVYYWKVEGQDAAGTKIADSSVYSFSLKSQSTQSRNVAVKSVELESAEADFKVLHFNVMVQNTGSTNEAGVSLRLSLSGASAQDSPRSIGMLNSGEQQSFQFTAFMPSGQDQGLAVACVDVFDDNVPDNCKTNLINKNAAQEALSGQAGESRNLSYQEIWDEIVKRLGPDAAKELDGYTFDSIECPNCTSGELNSLMLSLIQGKATLASASVVETSPAAAKLVAASTTTAALPEEEHELNVELASADSQKPQEWSGYTDGVKAEGPTFYAIRTAKEWEKIWKTISSAEVPPVDFSEKMVVGIIAGSGNRAATVRILTKRLVGSSLVFDYYMTESPAETHFMAYVFKAFPVEDGKVDFKRLDVGGRQ